MKPTDQIGSIAERDIAESLCEEFERELRTTRTFLERLSDDQLSWRPHEKSMTAGQLALHIAQTPAGVLQFSLQDEATAPDFSKPREVPRDMQHVLETLEGSADYVRQTLPTIDDVRMRETFTVVQAGGNRMSMPRADFLRAIMLNHWYHHRGQFGVYLRMLGAKVPSSYGPSGDE
jgi:uncharacterized damage-inducible protein DinB